jgi:Fe-S oxidoreductase
MHVVFLLIALIGLTTFAWMLARRLQPLLHAAFDPRFDRIPDRLKAVLKLWLGQWKQPRYPFAGILHIVVFFGFLILAARSIEMVLLGFIDNFSFHLGPLYDIAKDLAGAAVLAAVIVLAIRRAFFKPARYAGHTTEALLVLGLIATLMISELVFSRTHNLVAYGVHDVAFFFFLCFLPNGKHFHVITSLFNVFFMRLEKGNVKPVAYGVTDLDALQSFGIKKFEDFTWKHILDFYSCADCGRCSDRCPANRVKRPLAPRDISIKGREIAFGARPADIRATYAEDEIWSCTTCGACEEECPIGIEYIDKIVDLRRGMVDDGLVPQSLQKPMSALEKRGNPWGKLEKARAAWTSGACVPVKLVEKGETADTLYFVDSITSYDDRMKKIAQATARVLAKAEIDFAVIGKDEKDSGHDVRRFGEEMLFQTLKEQNADAIKSSEAKNIVCSDPHAMNALRHDYAEVPPVRHISEVIAEAKLPLKAINDAKTYTFHDPCYLGRHNETYDAPRAAIDGIPGIKRVEMSANCRDRSFCCGGGGLMLFYEPEEEQRMGVVRVEQARAAGADVIVTACPFCLTNIEDAIKVAGLEAQMEAIDLVELIDRQL